MKTPMRHVVMFDPPEGEKSISGPGPLIKAGTIHKLVERLTYHEYAGRYSESVDILCTLCKHPSSSYFIFSDPNLVRTFLMTYRSFCQPSELLDLLVERYKIPNPDGVDDQDSRKDPIIMKAMKRFKATYVTPIQLRYMYCILFV